MYLFRTILVSLIITLFTIPTLGQDSNTVNYSLFLEKTVTYGTVDTKIDEGVFKEGESFIIPEAELPSSPIDFSIYQDLYNALVGGRFGIDYGALNNDIIMKIFIRNLEPNIGEYLKLGENKDTLFSYFEIRIIELPDSNYYLEDTSYYFNDGYYANFALPKSDNLLNFFNIIGINTQDSLSFAYLEEDDNNKQNWNADGIVTIDDPDSIKFKAIHLSRIGGGRRRFIYGNQTGIKIKELNGLPNKINLYQNYPNPFNPTTKISYSINEPGNVKLEVYNILGKHVYTLLNKYQPAGNYSIEFSASDISRNMPSGIYFYSLKNGNAILTRKMILMK